MSKFSKQLSVLLLLIIICGGIFSPLQYAHAQKSPEHCQSLGLEPGTTQYDTCVYGEAASLSGVAKTATNKLGCGIDPGCWIAEFAIKVLLKLTSYITQLAGLGLNFAMNYTIVHMAENLENIRSIDITWGAVRDIANMAFIFVLLYASIRMIIGLEGNIQHLIKNIVLVAILINFSMFFTRVVIDAANVLAITFYSALVPNSTDIMQAGIANIYVDLLKVTTIWNNSGVLDDSALTTIGVMGSVVLLIAAVSFFIISVMLVIRYVVLILVIILAPVAFVSHILPGLEGQWKKWLDALTGQAFFAPIYLFLTWVSIKVLQGMSVASGNWGDALKASGGNGGNLYDSGAISLFINFCIVIVFMLAALRISKKWANRAGAEISTIAGSVLGTAGRTAGGLVFGGAGLVGRQTIGRVASKVSNMESLKEKASTSRLARLSLAASRKTSGYSFDARSTSAMGALSKQTELDLGKGAGKGGYEKAKKDLAKEKADFAASLAPSDESKRKVEREYEDAQQALILAKKSGDRNAIDAANRKLEEKRLRKAKVAGVTKEEADEAKEKVEKEKQTTLEKMDKNKEKILNDDPEIIAESEAQEELAKLQDELAKKERRLANTTVQAERDVLSAEIKTRMDEIDRKETELKVLSAAAKPRKEEINEEHDEWKKEVIEKYDEDKKSIKQVNVGERRKTKYADKVENSYWAKVRGYNMAASAQIRKGKSNKDRLAEAAKAVAEEDAPKKDEDKK